MVNIALAVIVHVGRVLIILRKRKTEEIPGLRWAFPGGKVKPEESFEQAVIREVAEETGLSVRVEALICERIIPRTEKFAR